MVMFSSYFKIAFRNLWKRKFYAFINIIGLAIGMACCLLITVYILNELSYDQFHEKADRIYRLCTNVKFGQSEFTAPATSPAVAGLFTEELPEVETAVRIDKFEDKIVKYENNAFTEKRVIAADADFFKVFSFPLVAGDPETALKEPNSVVITEAKAKKYFPDEDALGNTLYIDNELYKVTGIAREVPENSHIHFDFVFSFITLPKSKDTDWEEINAYTYFLLRENSDIRGVTSQLDPLLKKYLNYYEDIQNIGGVFEMFVQPLHSIHLHSHLQEELEPNGNIYNLYIFGAIALFIILIATSNFMNLATARSADRAKEVGVRKTLGSLRSTLVKQFLSEALLMTFLAVIVALGLSELLRIPFNQMAGRNISLYYFENPWLLPCILIFTLLVGLAAGSYPAFYLTRFQPVDVLRGRIAAGSKGSGFRNTLVVFQFVVSICLIICTLMVYQQLSFVRNKDLGFNKENVIILPQANKLDTHLKAFRNGLLQSTDIKSVSFSSNAPFHSYESSYFFQKGKEEQGQVINYLYVNYDYLETLGIQLKEGRNFSREIAGDAAGVLINEETVRQLGLEQPIGEILETDGLKVTVLGVFKDYNFESLHNKIHPLILLLGDSFSFTEIKVQSENLPATIQFIGQQWKQYTADTPFAYSFLYDDFNSLFAAEQHIGKIIGTFTILAIFVACLGLLALAAFMAEQRTKEIGIRKVMGAGVGHIVLLLSKDFTKLIGLAILISIPIAYFVMHRWLSGFAYRMDIGVGVFLMAGFSALCIAWITVSFQSIKAASVNPVESLRKE